MSYYLELNYKVALYCWAQGNSVWYSVIVKQKIIFKPLKSRPLTASFYQFHCIISLLVDSCIHLHMCIYTQINSSNRSDILIQPLLNDTSTHLNGESTSTAPIFYDLTPLSSQTTVGQPQLTNTTGAYKKQQQRLHAQSQTTRSPPPPNQPVAEVIGGLHLSPNRQQCPTCLTVFTMLGKREFQSHVAGCRKTS